MTTKSVTVIGLGPMGQAMVSSYLAGGYAVTVWNRTAEKAERMAREGAHRAQTAEDAFKANHLVVMSLTDYAAVDDILTQLPVTALAGRTIVNLTSDTPERARTMSAWLTKHGAVHVTGGVQVPPPLIGSSEAVSYVSGPTQAVETHRAALEVLTGIEHLGEDPGLAPLYYQIGIDMFWTGLLGYLHGQALARANGITAEQFLPRAVKSMDLRYFLEFYAPRIDAGNHDGDVDTLTMSAGSLEHVVRTAEDSGIDGSMPQALLDLVRRGIAAGADGNSLTSLINVLEGSNSAGVRRDHDVR